MGNEWEKERVSVGGVDEVVLDSACGGRDGMRFEVLLRLGDARCSVVSD
jgi:hypothetical protein